MQITYNVGIYARLSRDDERAGESVSIENQREMLVRHVQEQGWNLFDTYIDDGVSGTTFDRPGLNRLIADATDKKINLILCKEAEVKHGINKFNHFSIFRAALSDSQIEPRFYYKGNNHKFINPAIFHSTSI